MKRHVSLVLVLAMMITTVFCNVASASFPDVDSTNKYYKAIITLQSLKIISGDDSGKFNPENSITRAEFSKMIAGILGFNVDTATASEATEAPEAEATATPDSSATAKPTATAAAATVTATAKPTATATATPAPKGDDEGKYAFSDISGHWGAGVIEIAHDLGIIDGYDDGTFLPDDPITYEQALKMLVCTLGYQPNAVDMGGYPSGYTSEAQSLGVCKTITDQAYSEPATRQVIAQAVYNALSVYKQETDSSNNLKVTENTLLTDNLKVHELRGTLVGVESNKTNECNVQLGTYKLSIKDNSGTEHVIDFYEYANAEDTKTTPAELAKNLGTYMNVYYRQETSVDEAELVIMDSETTSNTTYEISYEDIIEYDGSSFKYYLPDSAVRKSLKIDADTVTVRYNGQTLESGTEYTIQNKDKTQSKTLTRDEAVAEWLNPSSDYFIYGDVSLIDSGSDGEINIVTINDYSVIIALKTPSVSDYRLQSKLVSGFYLDLTPDKQDVTTYIEKNGKEISATSISANDIISYTLSLDGENQNLYVCTNNSFTGDVTSINETENKITVGGTEYNMSDTLIQDVYNKESKTITLSSNITAYTDKLGTIVYATVNEAKEIPYAYIASMNIDVGTDEANMILFFPSTTSSGAKKYEIADKVKLSYTKDGEYKSETFTSNESLKSALEVSAQYSNADAEYADKIYGTGKTVTNDECSQLARVKLDSNNKVSEIIAIDGNQSAKQNEDNTVIARYYPLNKYYYSSSAFKESASGTTLFSMNSSTLVIYVPQDRSNRDKYAKRAVSSATFTAGSYYWVESYDVNTSRYSKVVILYGNTGSETTVSKTMDISIVGSAPVQTYDEEEGEIVQKISFYTASNTAKEWTTDTTDEFADASIGDVMQFGYNAENKIKSRAKVMDYADIQSILDGETTEVTYDNGLADEPSDTGDDTDGDESNDVVTDDTTQSAAEIEADDSEQNATVTATEKYNWTKKNTTQDSSNRYQKFVYDFRYPKSNPSNLDSYYETYTTTEYGTIPYTRACMYNVYKILEDSKKIQVTRDGFDATTGEMRDSELVNLDEYTYSTSTKIIRLERNATGTPTGLSKYVEDTTTDLTVTDLKCAVDYGQDCSKVLICSRTGSVRLIVIYD